MPGPTPARHGGKGQLLTGTLARRFFEQALQREIRNVHRNGGSVALLTVDLDDMKGVNDTGGHLSGDQALALTGKLLRRATRATDFVGRYGGDEFAILLPGADRSGAEVVMARIREGFNGAIVSAPVGPLPMSGSVGCAVLEVEADGERFPNPEVFERKSRDLIQRAEEALYAAKRARRTSRSAGRERAVREDSRSGLVG